MRSLIICLFLTVLAGIPSVVVAQDATPAASPVAACAPGTRDGNVAVAETYLGVWNSHDVSTFDEIADPGVVHHWGQGHDTVGIPDLKTSTQAFFEAFPDLVMTFDDVIVEGDEVVIRWTLTGTQQGPFFGIEPTGITATWTGVNIYRVSCGKVVESWSEADGIGLRQQLGVPGAVATPQP
jgi:predicted ester cyclase